MSTQRVRFTLSKPWQNVVLGLLALIVVLVGFVVWRSEAPVTPEASKAAAVEAARIEVKRPTSTPLSVLFAGDSLTDGAHASAPEMSFTSLIEAELRKGGEVTGTKIGGSGRTTAKVQQEADSLDGPFQVAFVELGTNDVYAYDPDAFATEYPALLNAVRVASPETALVCAGVWSEWATNRKVLNEIIHTECEKRGGNFVDLNPVRDAGDTLTPKGTLLPDGTQADGSHPNDEGHRLISDALLAAIKFP